MSGDQDGRAERSGPDEQGAAVAHDRPGSEVDVPRVATTRWQAASDEVLRVFPVLYATLWIVAFSFGHWPVGLAMVLLTGPAMALVRGPRGGVRRQVRKDRHRAQRRALYDRRVVEREMRRQGHEVVRSQPVPPQERLRPPDAPAPAPPTPARDPHAPERALAAAVAAARRGPAALDPDALALVEELDTALRPMLARARQGGLDAAVRRELESIATEHLPEALRTYQQLPPGYAHQRSRTDDRTPAEELRSQLGLLVEGCAPLRDAVHGADVARQRELGRFLEAKFRRSDLDL